MQTAEDSVSAPVNLDARDFIIDLPLVLLDSPQRDRCPYVGDQAVDGLHAARDRPGRGGRPGDAAVVRVDPGDPDGSIPSSPIFDAGENLVDYNAYWIEALYDYVLYTGDVAFLKRDHSRT